ncbi:MAG: LysR family transcriptional regulator [Phascolarctobacterium sp.]|uniref:LysR family transcriptional regulator n=1 Tax=Phascolarctobacterium sp. TaxID=2049039 RepID=UPI0026DDBFF1|nr:LysR family transcriptional regulator [Phascolarctobacterium sp.]MDO4920413.1 LysR family transcriptional regulator [Phascolarctobacterium sp.]
MLLRQMKYFLAVADCKSFSEAAEQCFISQSAISQQVKALEDELGTELILRSNRRFALTPAGEFFYQKAKAIVQETENLKNNLYQLERRQESRLRIGCRSNYNVAIMSHVLKTLLPENQDIAINITYGEHDALMNKLLAGELDIAINDLRSEDELKKFCCHHIESVNCLVAISLQNTLVPPSCTNFIEVTSIKNMPCILIADRDSLEQEKLFYRRILNFNGSFLIAKDIPSALAMIINNEGFMPITSNGGICNFLGKFTRLTQLYNNGAPIRFEYYAFWNKNADMKLLKPIMQKFGDAYRDVLTGKPDAEQP